MNLRIIRLALVFTTLTVIAAHVAVQSVFFISGPDAVIGFPQVFNMNHANTLPAWYSAALCLAASAAVGRIAAAERRRGSEFWPHWATLAMLFLGLAVDELTRVHEVWAHSSKEWLLAGAAVVVLIGVSLLRFLEHLPSTTRTLFLGSAVAFAAASIGMEAFEEAIGDGAYTPASMVAGTLEEGIEMASVALFLHGALAYYCTETQEGEPKR